MWIHTSLLLLLILLVLALSCPASSLDSSPTASPSSAHAPASNGSQDPALRNTSAIDNPAYAFSRGFDKSYQRMTILISTLFIAFVCFGFCAHYVTFRSCYTHTAATRRHNVDGLQANEQDLTGREGAPGLEPWLVRSLPVVKYSAQREKQDEGTAAASMAQVIVKLQECAVCLSEFEEGEEMKELPVCRHSFHKACIDMWLFSHTTCPICRLSLRKHFKDAHTKSSMDQSSPNRLPQAAPRSPSRLPRGPHIAVHLEVTVPLDVPAASTSSAFHAIVVNADDVDDDEAEHARNSSAALYQRFPSSA